MRRPRVIPGGAPLSVLLTVLFVLLATGAGARAAVLTGISDNGAGLFDTPTYRALNLNAVRFVIPWDVGARTGPWDAPLLRAQQDGADVVVAFEHDDASRCPQAPCVLPAEQAYADAVGAFLGAHPSVHTITPWNEPNHAAQPTAHRPGAAAAYYDAARRVCPSCTVVAGDFLDGATLPDYLAAYQAALETRPLVWGLHDYYDATYFQSTGVDTMLRATTGALWLTETGGIVSFTSATGALPYDEQRAADAVSWVYQLADARPRVTRVYLHQWQGQQDNPFDSGLIGYDGTPRPAYAIVRDRVGPRPTTGGPGAVAVPAVAQPLRGSTADPAKTLTPWIPAQPVVLAPPGRRARFRTERRLRVLRGSRLELRARCLAFGSAEARCRQRLVARVGGRVLARPAVDVRVGASFVRVVRLPRWARRQIRRDGVALQSCAVRRPVCTARLFVPIRFVDR